MGEISTKGWAIINPMGGISALSLSESGAWERALGSDRSQFDTYEAFVATFEAERNSLKHDGYRAVRVKIVGEE